MERNRRDQSSVPAEVEIFLFFTCPEGLHSTPEILFGHQFHFPGDKAGRT
jgi:hypothetical protein